MIRIEADSLAGRLEAILSSVEQGENVLVIRNGLPIARVVGVGLSMGPGFGGAKELISIPEDFDAPLSDFAEYSQH